MARQPKVQPSIDKVATLLQEMIGLLKNQNINKNKPSEERREEIDDKRSDLDYERRKLEIAKSAAATDKEKLEIEIELKRIKADEHKNAILLNKLEKENLEIDLTNVATQKDKADIIRSAIKLKEEEIIKNKEALKASRDALLTDKESLDAEEKKLKNLDKQNETIKKQGALLEGLVKKSAALVANFVNLQNNFTPSKLVETIKTFDDAMASFTNKTGLGNRNFQQQIIVSQKSLAQYGATFDSQTARLAAAKTSIIGFNNSNKSFQDSIIETGTQLEKLGVGAEAYHKGVNTLNTTLGITAEKASDMQIGMLGYAEQLGVSATDLHNEFISSMNSLAIYGGAAEEKFKKLKATAYAANVEMSAMTDLNEKLSTFEGAGTFAGRMNAMTGLDLFDVNELIGLEGADKTAYIIEKIKSSGLNVSDPKVMRAASQASGLDPQTFMKLYNMSYSKLRTSLRAAELPGGGMDKTKLADIASQGTTRAAAAAGRDQSLMMGIFGKEGYKTFLTANNLVTKAMMGLGGTFMLLGTSAISLALQFRAAQGIAPGSMSVGQNAAKWLGSGGNATKLIAGSALAGGALAGVGKYAAGAGAANSILSGLAGAGGVAGGAALGAAIGTAGLPVIGTAVGALVGAGLGLLGNWLVDNYLVKPDYQDTQDGAISTDGRPIIASAGQLLRGTKHDIPMLVDSRYGLGGNTSNNDSMNDLIKSVKAIASRPVIIQVDGREIAKVANMEMTPRFAG